MAGIRGISRWRLRRARLREYVLGDRRIDLAGFAFHVVTISVVAKLIALVPYAPARQLYVELIPILIWPEIVGRLHDVGRSGWWSIGPIACLAAIEAAAWQWGAIQEPGMRVALVIGLTIWMGFSIRMLAGAGDVGPNRYGPDPRGGVA
jgi:uncharacterized membrane protein YhaH (DUF805 family)